MRVPPPLVFLALIGVGMAIDRFAGPFALPVSRSVRLACAVVFGLAGLAAVSSALWRFYRTGQDPEPWKPSPVLIGQGPYRFSRNPMYLGMVLLQISAGVILDNLWIVLLSGPALLVVHFTAVKPEERYLAAKFGEAYRDYCALVPRYLGLMRKG